MSARLRALLHLRSERGQTSAEYLGIVVFVVAVIAALYALAPGIGDSLAEKVREQVSAIATPGDGSGAGGPVPAGGEPVGEAPAGEEDDPGLLEQGFDALGDGAGALAGGLGDLASGAGDLASGGLDLGGDLLSGAGDLLSGAPGDVLREPDGERAAVESVRVMAPAPERVHNLTVAGLHTYYAGQAPVLVHNAGCLTDGERIGIVREALQRKGNYGLGSASRREADELGQAFVGPGFTRSRREPGILLSRDGLRRYRPPSFKPELGRYQANLERRFEPGPRQRFNGNGHLDISDP